VDYSAQIDHHNHKQLALFVVTVAKCVTGKDIGQMFAYAFRCVRKGIHAVGHAVRLNFQEYGYIMAVGYLPPDETGNMTDPEMAEYAKRHAS